MLIILTSAAVLLGAWAPAWAQSPDRARLRETLKALWDGIETLEFESDQTFPDLADGPPKPTSPFPDLRSTFRYQMPNRFAFSSYFTRPKVDKPSLLDYRYDGQRLHRIVRAGDDMGSPIDQVIIDKQVGGPGEYTGILNHALIAWMPGSKPAYAQLDDGARLEFVADGERGEQTWLVGTDRNVRQFRAELDPEHDWLPRRVEFVDGHTRLDVTKFGRDNGRWFPVEGKGTRRHTAEGAEDERTEFRVTLLKINRPLPDGCFAVPPLPKGARVVDQTNDR